MKNFYILFFMSNNSNNNDLNQSEEEYFYYDTLYSGIPDNSPNTDTDKINSSDNTGKETEKLFITKKIFIKKKRKGEKIKKSKTKTKKQNYECYKRKKEDKYLIDLNESYVEGDRINESELYDIKKDKYDIQTFSGESQQLSSNQIFSRNSSKENQITNDIEIYPFNHVIFEENESKYEKSIKFDEPKFIYLDDIMKEHKEYIEKLWSKEIQIFKDKNDLDNTLKNGTFCQNIYNLLKKKEKPKERKYQGDSEIKKIKTHLLEIFRNYINLQEEMKCSNISKLKKDLINQRMGALFNLIYLTQYLYNILSNESNETNKDTNKYIIELIKNEKASFFYKYFFLTIQNCLDIFRYKEKNPHFKDYKIYLVEFLKNQYDIEKKNNKKDVELKDYIAALFLLTYNYERFFYLRLKDSSKNNNN